MQSIEERVRSPRDVYQFLQSAGLDIEYETGRRFHSILTLLRATKEEEPEWFVEYIDEPNEKYEQEFRKDIIIEEVEKVVESKLSITVPKVPITSFCAHHILPWVGYVHIAYIPNDRVLGLSKFKRMVDFFSRGLTIQEDVTKVLHKRLSEVLNTNVTVKITAMHTCAIARGIQLDPSFRFETECTNESI